MSEFEKDSDENTDEDMNRSILIHVNQPEEGNQPTGFAVNLRN